MEEKRPRQNIAEIRRLQKLRREQQKKENKPKDVQNSPYPKHINNITVARKVEKLQVQNLETETNKVLSTEGQPFQTGFERARGKAVEINPFASSAQQIDHSALNPFTIFGKLISEKKGENSTIQVCDTQPEKVMEIVKRSEKQTLSFPTHLTPLVVQRQTTASNISLREDVHESSHFKSSDESDEHSDASLSDYSDGPSDVEDGGAYMRRKQRFMQSNHKYEINDDSKILKIPSNYMGATTGADSQDLKSVDSDDSRSVLFNLLERRSSQLESRNDDQDVNMEAADTFAPTENPSSEAISTDNAISADAAISQKPRQGSQMAPFDWTIKVHLTFTSAKPFQWCDSLVSAHQTEALSSFVKSHDPEHVNSQLKKHLHSWVYPTSENPKPYTDYLMKVMSKTSSLLAEEKQSITEFKGSIEEWKDAFRSLYYSLRNGACSYFYYINDQFSVLFKSKNVANSGEFEAIMSKSTHGLRKVLQDEGIDFAIPLDRLSSDVLYRGMDDPISDEERQEILKELEALEMLNPGSTSQKNVQFNWDNSYRSALYFSGHPNVHGLFDFLLNWKDSRLEHHVKGRPRLVSPDPFLNASIRSAKIAKNGKVHRAAIDATNGQEFLQTFYKIELTGLFLPTSVHLLMELFKETQERAFEVNLKTDNRTLGLNIPIPFSSTQDHSTRLSHVLRESRVKVGSLKTITCTPESHFLY